MRASVRRAGDVDRQLVDAFWGFKHLVYTQLINAELGVLADAACQQSMRDNIVSFTRDDYFTDEAAAFRKMPGLRELLVRRDFGAEAANRPDAQLRSDGAASSSTKTPISSRGRTAIAISRARPGRS